MKPVAAEWVLMGCIALVGMWLILATRASPLMKCERIGVHVTLCEPIS